MIDKVYLNPNTGMLTSEPTSGDDIKFIRESSDLALRCNTLYAEREMYKQEKHDIIKQLLKVEKERDELKKLTENSSWKPTQEQVKMLRALLDYNIGVFDYKGWNIVDELCKQLENKLC